MPIKVPLCFRNELGDDEPPPLLVDRRRSSWESLPGLVLLSRLPDGEGARSLSPSFRTGGDTPSLNMWTVSVAEETHSSDEVVLKDML